MNPKMSRWLRIISVSAMLVGVTWGIGSFILSRMPSFPSFSSVEIGGGGLYNVIFIGILVLVGLSIWQIVASKSAHTASTISGVLNEQPIRGILIGSVLLVVAYLAYDYFWLWAALLIEYSGIGMRTSLFFVGILVLLAMPSVFVFFSPTGLPVEVQTVKSARTGLLCVWLLFFGWLYHERPNDLADYKSGVSQCYQTEGDPQIYSAPGYSTVTGKQLSKCSEKQALQAAQKPWTYQIFDTVMPILEETKERFKVWMDSAKIANAKESLGEEFKPIPSGRKITLEVGKPRQLYFKPSGFAFMTDGKVRIKCFGNKCIDSRDGKMVKVDEMEWDLAELHKKNLAHWTGPQNFIVTMTPIDKPITILTLG